MPLPCAPKVKRLAPFGTRLTMFAPMARRFSHEARDLCLNTVNVGALLSQSEGNRESRRREERKDL
jgi:hypothetical protein